MGTKHFKRKLIFELGTGCKSQKDIPTEYSNNKLRWQCDVIIEDSDDLVNEYTIAPDRKIFLNDFLEVVKEEVVKITDSKATSWGMKMYRIVPKKR